jgi:hypothetical protein
MWGRSEAKGHEHTRQPQERELDAEACHHNPPTGLFLGRSQLAAIARCPLDEILFLAGSGERGGEGKVARSCTSQCSAPSTSSWAMSRQDLRRGRIVVCGANEPRIRAIVSLSGSRDCLPSKFIHISLQVDGSRPILHFVTRRPWR